LATRPEGGSYEAECYNEAEERDRIQRGTERRGRGYTLSPYRSEASVAGRSGASASRMLAYVLCQCMREGSIPDRFYKPERSDGGVRSGAREVIRGVVNPPFTLYFQGACERVACGEGEFLRSLEAGISYCQSSKR